MITQANPQWEENLKNVSGERSLDVPLQQRPRPWVPPSLTNTLKILNVVRDIGRSENTENGEKNARKYGIMTWILYILLFEKIKARNDAAIMHLKNEKDFYNSNI